MDSSPPPPSPTAAARQLRPFYLVAAMILTWFIGVHGMTSAFATLSFLREGHIQELSSLAPDPDGDAMQLLVSAYQLAEQAAVAEAHRIVFPLSVASLLLSGLLVVASGLAMAGRPGARKLALQAIAANVLLAVVGYTLTHGVRGVAIEAVAKLASTLTLPEEQQPFASTEVWWWLQRVRFAVFDLGSFAAAAYALTRPRSKAYFDATAAAIQRAEGP